MCRRVLRIAVVGLLLAVPIGSSVLGQSIDIKGGPTQLDITTATPGQNPPPATDASTTLRISERRDGAFKITVSTTAPGQRYDLRVEATGLNSGVSQGEVSLVDGMASADLIRNVDLCDRPGGGPPGGGPPGGGPPGGGPPGGGPPCREEATLRYRAFVAADDGAGSDSHTVQYTILAQ